MIIYKTLKNIIISSERISDTDLSINIEDFIRNYKLIDLLCIINYNNPEKNFNYLCYSAFMIGSFDSVETAKKFLITKTLYISHTDLIEDAIKNQYNSQKISLILIDDSIIEYITEFNITKQNEKIVSLQQIVKNKLKDVKGFINLNKECIYYHKYKCYSDTTVCDIIKNENLILLGFHFSYMREIYEKQFQDIDIDIIKEKLKIATKIVLQNKNWNSISLFYNIIQESNLKIKLHHYDVILLLDEFRQVATLYFDPINGTQQFIFNSQLFIKDCIYNFLTINN